MVKQSSQKLKILHLRQILLDETDDDHGLGMAEIIGKLAEKGISAERKSIYRDLDALRDYGMDIIKRSNVETGIAEYAVGSREFEMPELLLLVDAVQNSQFLTERKSCELVDQIGSLASRFQSRELAGRVHVEGRIKMQNESVYYHVNDIQQAISRRRKLAFNYVSYDVAKRQVLRKGGKVYRENPIQLVYRDGFYYLIAYNDRHDSFLRYRVDRMRAICVLDEPAVSNEKTRSFDVGEFVAQSFFMHDGVSRTVELEVDASLVGVIIDRFGREVQMMPEREDRALVAVRVMVSRTFFGWLAQFGTGMCVMGPHDVARQYRDYLVEIVDLYDHVASGGAD